MQQPVARLKVCLRHALRPWGHLRVYLEMCAGKLTPVLPVAAETWKQPKVYHEGHEVSATAAASPKHNEG